ncbi:MAG: hypothetical protein HYX92_06160 [Chloroflexi bacterium]|nr:hypothetical protein [Chloroflexota bacterium]
MRDAVEFQKRGLPTVTICHDAFEVAARSQAVAMGYAGMPLVAIRQAQPGDDRDAFRDRAEKALPAIVAALADPSPRTA